ALLLTACVATAQVAATQPAITEGRDYFPIEPAQPTTSDDKIEVVEVFGYSCVHCATLQPFVDAWKPKLADDVEFTYMPAVFGGIWEVYGRAYYTAETMGVLEKTHSDLFKALHVERRPIRSLEDVAAFYGDYGVDPEEFLGTMQSFAVNAKIARATQTVQRYGVEGTPTMVVNGKYRVPAPREGGFERQLQIVDQLVEMERAAAKAS